MRDIAGVSVGWFVSTFRIHRTNHHKLLAAEDEKQQTMQGGTSLFSALQSSTPVAPPIYVNVLLFMDVRLT